MTVAVAPAVVDVVVVVHTYVPMWWGCESNGGGVRRGVERNEVYIKEWLGRGGWENS